MLLNSEWVNNEIKEDQKIPWNNWKRTEKPKIYGTQWKQWKREFHSITGLSQETRKTPNKKSNYTLKGTCKRTNKAQSK